MNVNELYLSVGGVSISLSFDSTEWDVKKTIFIQNIKLYLKGFIVNKNIPQVFITVKESKGIPFRIYKKDFYSQYYKQKSISRYETYYHISIFELCQLLQLILMKYLKNKVLFLHASGVIIHKKSTLFIGKSGTGKSTCIKLLKNIYKPIADDSIIVRKEGDSYYCYQTPTIDKEDWIVRKNKKYILHSLFIIDKNKLFKINKLSAYTFLPYIYESIWVENEIDRNQTKSCIALLKQIKNLYSIAYKKQDKKKLINALQNLK
jgi:hypothetical protein